MTASAREACVVIGAGDALGSAIARRFAAAGLVAVPVRRQAEKLATLADQICESGGHCLPIGADAREEHDAQALFDRAEREAGPPRVLVFNIGPNVWWPLLETESQKYLKTWEIACFSGFLCVREAARRMARHGRGTILITGATASLRGIKAYAAFSGAKQALRALAQSAAKELGPQNIHVAHVVIDGLIDTAPVSRLFPEKYALKAADGIMDPDHIADAYYFLHAQPRDAWTFEMDLRPYMESW
ncbi:SDR family NAD(P)-dependent oxidoreductase [Reyranella sp. CPCC 100927]|uniref:SDR family NAD(P)-dependent oxidoreductase n=1 Tax=Reyranella sp. CPCC 100927 TaxID=2599616 RepID=UPI0011B3BE79|nr:SDR family NAD(P)-dependent oxidoreductase [Reyranella sp. CPCC 100927]TWT09514.1 SDR family NAD(P)-dependent oxidoreductase [Reyranella sp. CPCC 100927]